MEACHANANVVLGGSGEMGFIFPQLHPGFDAMFCIAKLIELLSLQQHDLYSNAPRTLGQLRAELPRVSHRSLTVRCPWAVKGSLMRHLVETHPTENLDLTDGVKIFNAHHDSWVLVLPDAGEPLVHLYADSGNRGWVDETLREYRAHVQEFVDRDHALSSGPEDIE
jgi:mannose-1-phosphate guanylyltransferase / phosphomannomutase